MCQFFTPCTQTKSPIAIQTESSEQYCEARHNKDLRPAQQADLGQFMWSIEAHLLLYGHYHGDLVSLSSGITGDSSVNWQNAEEVGEQLQQQVLGKSFAVSKNEEGQGDDFRSYDQQHCHAWQEGKVSPQPPSE